jgi:hypothetical protein
VDDGPHSPILEQDIADMTNISPSILISGRGETLSINIRLLKLLKQHKQKGGAYPNPFSLLEGPGVEANEDTFAYYRETK